MIDADSIIASMRTLPLLGVTHFVVSDGLLQRLRKKTAADIASLNNKDFLITEGDAPEDTPLHFRGHQILTQDDLKHLPFDTFRPPAGSTRAQADFGAEFREAGGP